MTGQLGTGALAAPAQELVQRFRSALGGEPGGAYDAHGGTGGTLVSGDDEVVATPGPFGLLAVPESTAPVTSRLTGDDDGIVPLELRPQDAANLMQALLPWLPALTTFAETRIGLAPAAAGGAATPVALDALPTEATVALRDAVAVALEPSAGEPGRTRATDVADGRGGWDTPAFVTESARLMELLPRVSNDGPMRAVLGSVGLTPERLGAWLPSLQSSAMDPSILVLLPAARSTGGWGTDEESSRGPGSVVIAEETTVTLGTTLLQSLASQSAGAASTVAAPQAPSFEHIEALQEMVAETVSRVLVSDPLHDGRREVRISLASDVLPKTEIRLWRQENRLHVEFVTTAAVADAGLQEGLPRLAEAIQHRQPQAELPLLSVRLADGSGQPEDGRSRQRYLTPEELEDGA